MEQFEKNHKIKFFENPIKDYIFVIKKIPLSQTIQYRLNSSNTYSTPTALLLLLGDSSVINMLSQWDIQGIYYKIQKYKFKVSWLSSYNFSSLVEQGEIEINNSYAHKKYGENAI